MEQRRPPPANSERRTADTVVGTTRVATGRFGNGDNEGDEDVDDSTTSSERDQLDDQPQTTTDDSNGDGDSDSNATAARAAGVADGHNRFPIPEKEGVEEGGWWSVGQENLPRCRAGTSGGAEGPSSGRPDVSSVAAR
ncbi:hypothetical protein D8S78_24040 [Natrialba swarupiae]|nr:hypothetical protein [Natrialba swarupiae]